MKPNCSIKLYAKGVYTYNIIFHNMKPNCSIKIYAKGVYTFNIIFDIIFMAGIKVFQKHHNLAENMSSIYTAKAICNEITNYNVWL